MDAEFFTAANLPPVVASPQLFIPPTPPFPTDITCGLQVFGQQMNGTLKAHSDVDAQSFDFYCMIHLIKGSAWYWSESNGRVPVQASQLLIIPPNTPHDFAAGKDETTIDMLCFCGPMAEMLCSSKVLNGGVADFGQARQLLPIIETSIQMDSDHQIKAAISIMNLLSNHHFNSKSRAPGSKSKIGALITLMKDNPERWWDSCQMAEYCSISEVQLRRLFKKETGYSPKVYLDKVKVEHAAKLLKKDFSVGIVSELLGYSDQFHFSRRFKSIMGLSPRDFLANQ